MPTTAVEVVDLAHGVVEARRDNAELVKRHSDVEKKLKEAQSAERTTCKELDVADARMKMLKARLNEAGAARKKLKSGAAATESGLHARIVSLEK